MRFDLLTNNDEKVHKQMEEKYIKIKEFEQKALEAIKIKEIVKS
jgi:hypothetical protein